MTENATANAEGQVVMPFYILCDVSGSMVPDIEHLNKALADLHTQLLREPIINDLVMLSIISFNHDARTEVPLDSPERISLPRLSASGRTDYSPPLRLFHQNFEADRQRLKDQGMRVYRPCVYFLTDGEPNNNSYIQTFASLLAKEVYDAYPYVCAFGFRDATEATLRTLAYPNFGEEHKRGRYFIARQGAQVTDLFQAIVGVICQSVLKSAQSASGGAPTMVMPPPQGVPGMVGSFV
jgi:uncharacterized protein YegL